MVQVVLDLRSEAKEQVRLVNDSVSNVTCLIVQSIFSSNGGTILFV